MSFQADDSRQHNESDQSNEKNYPRGEGDQWSGNTETPKASKRYLFRLIRLGTSLALAVAALVLTLIILVVGRHGNASSDLALITVDMTNFARFTPPTITLVHDTDATKTRRGFGDSIISAASSAESSVETFASGAASAVETAASSVETAVSGAVSSAEDEADKIISDIGDSLEDIEAAVEGLMDKVLDTIQDELNKWLLEAASALDDLDISRKMSLHLTTACSSPAGATGNDTNSTEITCSPLFTSGETTFNSTANNGTIFGFQPGNILAEALGVFFIPVSAQDDIRAPVDNATNKVQKLMTEAGSEVSSWTVNLLFIPIVAVYVLAAIFMCLLLLILIAATVLTVKGHDSVPAKVYSLCATISALATFFLFLGSVILTVIALIAYVLGLGGNVVGIVITSGSRLKWLSWAAFIIMLLVTVSLKLEEFVADCVFWWNFLSKLLSSKKHGGVRGIMAAEKNNEKRAGM